MPHMWTSNTKACVSVMLLSLFQLFYLLQSQCNVSIYVGIILQHVAEVFRGRGVGRQPSLWRVQEFVISTGMKVVVNYCWIAMLVSLLSLLRCSRRQFPSRWRTCC